MEYWQLKQRQGLPLEVKIQLSQKKIREFYDHYHGARIMGVSNET